jgi:hypothetical protein
MQRVLVAMTSRKYIRDYKKIFGEKKRVKRHMSARISLEIGRCGY